LLPYLAILCLVLIGLFVLLQGGPLMEHLRRGVVAELRRQTGREVQVGRVTLSLTGRAVLRDVAVKGQGGSAFLSCPLVTVRVGTPSSGGWLPSLSGPLEVRDVRLVRPRVVLSRSADGKWSISDLFKRKPGAPPFRGSVEVEKGKVVLVDQAREGLATAAEEVELETRGEGTEGRWYRVRASGTEGAWDRCELEARSSPTEGWRVSGRVSNVDLSYAMERLTKTPAVTVSAGRGEMKGEVALAPAQAASSAQAGAHDAQLSYRLEVRAIGGEVSFPWLKRPAQSVEGTATFENGELKLEGIKGKVADAPVKVSGTVGGLTPPGPVTVGLDVEVSGIRAQQVGALLPKVYIPPALLLPSPVRITARAEGPAKEVIVSGRAEVRVIKFRLIPWRDVVAKFRYQNGALAITGLSAHGSPRRLEADLSLGFRKNKRKASARVRLTAVPVATLAQMAGVQLRDLEGLADVKAEVSLTPTARESSGEVVIEKTVFRGVELGRVRASFRLSGKRLTVTQGVIEGPLASGSFSGEVAVPDRFRVTTKLASLDLGALGKALGMAWLRGEGPGELTASGAVGRPEMAGTVRLGPGKLWEVPFDQASASFALSSERACVSDVEVRQGEGKLQGQAELRGWRGGNPAARLEGRAKVAGVKLQDLTPPALARWVPQGTLAGELALAGTRARPSAAADLHVEVSLVPGVPVEVGSAHLRYEGGRLLVDEASLAAGGSQVLVTGQYAPDSGLALEVVGDPVDLGTALAGARTRYGLVMSGQAKLKSRVTGPLTRPRVAVGVSSETLVVNGIAISEVAFAGTLTGWPAEVRIDQAVVRQGESEMSASGEVGRGLGQCDLTGKLRSVDLGVVQRIANTAAWRREQLGGKVPHREIYTTVPTPLGGVVTAEAVRLTGDMTSPSLEVGSFAIEGLSFAGREIEHVEGSLLLSKARVKFAVRARHEAVHARVEGDVRFGGDVSVTADVGNLDLRLVEPWVRGAAPQIADLSAAGAQAPGALGGEADINFDVTGTTREPRLVGDIVVRGLKVGPVELEAAETGRMTLDAEGVLRLDEIRLVKGPMEGTGTAAIPIPFPWQQERERKPPTAELSIRNASVGLLPGAAPAVLDADLALRDNQILVGRLSLGGQIEAAGIHGTMGDGSFAIAGKLNVRSYAPARWANNDFDFAAELNQVQLEVPQLVKGRLDGRLYLARAGRRTVLKTGEEAPLVFSDATITVPRRPVTVLPAVGLGRPPEVKVRVVTGDEVWLTAGSRERPTQIRISPGAGQPGRETSGYLDVEGVASAAGLTANGEVESEYGVLAFPNGTLRLRSGRAWLTREAGQRLRVRVSAEANGRVQDYYVSISPAGQVYPSLADDPTAQFSLNAASSPPLEEAYVKALLVGPLAAPTPGMESDLPTLLAAGGRPAGGGGEVTGLRVAPLSGALGLHEFALDFDLRGPVHMRVGERIMRRFIISYISTLSDPAQSQTMRVTYEVNPRIALGWSVDELGRGRWEVQSFRLF
jgi:hypothetical protein